MRYVFCNFGQDAGVINNMKSNLHSSSKMKTTAFLLIAALVAPAALALGVSAAIVSSAATGIALTSIALSDYGKPTCTYLESASVKRVERHPLAA